MTYTINIILYLQSLFEIYGKTITIFPAINGTTYNFIYLIRNPLDKSFSIKIIYTESIF